MGADTGMEEPPQNTLCVLRGVTGAVLAPTQQCLDTPSSAKLQEGPSPCQDWEPLRAAAAATPSTLHGDQAGHWGLEPPGTLGVPLSMAGWHWVGCEVPSNPTQAIPRSYKQGFMTQSSPKAKQLMGEPRGQELQSPCAHGRRDAHTMAGPCRASPLSSTPGAAVAQPHLGPASCPYLGLAFVRVGGRGHGLDAARGHCLQPLQAIAEG